MEKDLFEKASDGKPIDVKNDIEFKTICLDEIRRSRKLCNELNLIDPNSNDYMKKLGELFMDQIKDGTYIEPPLQVDYGRQIKIGKGVFIGNNFAASSFGKIEIEDDCQIALRCTIATVNHCLDDLNKAYGKKVLIKKGAWIGANVTILPGVTIGEGAVVGAGSVVVKDVNDYDVVVGNPARVIKNRRK